MVELTLPKNSRMVTGKTWPKPEGAKNARAFKVYRYNPDTPENPRVDTYFVDLVHALDAGERVHPVDVHGTGPADPLAARPPERQRRIDLVLDLDQRIQNHRPAGVHVDEIGIHPGVLLIVRIPSINLHLTQIRRALRPGPRLARPDRRILGEG